MEKRSECSRISRASRRWGSWAARNSAPRVVFVLFFETAGISTYIKREVCAEVLLNTHHPAALGCDGGELFFVWAPARARFHLKRPSADTAITLVPTISFFSKGEVR